jgi:hypothetical protein
MSIDYYDQNSVGNNKKKSTSMYKHDDWVIKLPSFKRPDTEAQLYRHYRFTANNNNNNNNDDEVASRTQFNPQHNHHSRNNNTNCRNNNCDTFNVTTTTTTTTCFRALQNILGGSYNETNNSNLKLAELVGRSLHYVDTDHLMANDDDDEDVDILTPSVTSSGTLSESDELLVMDTMSSDDAMEEEENVVDKGSNGGDNSCDGCGGVGGRCNQHNMVLYKEMEKLYRDIFLYTENVDDILSYPYNGWELYRDTNGIIKSRKPDATGVAVATATTHTHHTNIGFTNESTTSLCIICCENPRDLVFMNCQHCTVCKVCYLTMLANKLECSVTEGFHYPLCPTCRKPVEKCMKVIL